MTPLDLALAAAGWLHATVSRNGKAKTVPWLLAIGLLTASAIPAYLIGSTPTPAAISFADLQAGRLPAQTAWFRLEGELRVAADGEGRYTIHDPADADRFVTVVSAAPLEPGFNQVTGRISGARSVPGSFATLRADVPIEPARRDPWLLYALPALLVIPLVVGASVGYPVVRREDRPREGQGEPLSDGTTVPARWTGWVGNDQAGLRDLRPCTVSIARDGDIRRMTISEGATTRTILVRADAANPRIRLCRLGGCLPGLEVHGQAADVTLVIKERALRDRLAATLS